MPYIHILTYTTIACCLFFAMRPWKQLHSWSLMTLSFSAGVLSASVTGRSIWNLVFMLICDLALILYLVFLQRRIYRLLSRTEQDCPGSRD